MAAEPADPAPARLDVTVVVAVGPRNCQEIRCAPAPGSTVGQLLGGLGLLVPDDRPREVGVWGRKVPLSHLLRDGDRVELYRPLRVDPKVARRERFAKQGARAAGLFARKPKSV